MSPSDLTTEVLVQIREELRGMRKEVSELRVELRADVQDVRREMADLRRVQTESEIRLATAMAALAGTVGEVRDILREGVKSRLDDHEARLAKLERKTG